jgi:hypothetical protein
MSDIDKDHTLLPIPYNFLAVSLISISNPLQVYNPQDSIPPRSIVDMNDELTAFIIKELSRHHDRKDIVRRVCEREGLHWKQGEQLVILIEARHNRSMKVNQAPLLLFLSIGILILGVGLLGFNLQILITFFQRDVLLQILSLQSGSYRVVGVLTGLGMILGGLVGLWKSFGTMFPK